jgi:hypothetical protein
MDIDMPEETKNAAVSGESKLVPVTQLKKWHRDLDACQKVIWLRGGFDPAYCLDAQDCLKEMEGVMAAPVPPAGPAPKVHRYRVVKMLSEDGNKVDYNPHGPWVVMADVHDAHVTRLQAENTALQQRLTIADQRVDDLTALAKSAYMEGWEVGWVERHTDGNNDKRVSPWAPPRNVMDREWLTSEARAALQPAPVAKDG